MTAGLEAATAEEHIYGLLHGDATLMGLVGDIWDTQAPQGATFPFVVYQFMTGNDLMEVASIRIWSNMLFLIKVVGQTGNYSDLNAAVARIDTLLHRTSGAVADGTVWACIRQQVFRLPEMVSGKQYRSAGAIWRIYAT
jgi:hypothetical protein